MLVALASWQLCRKQTFWLHFFTLCCTSLPTVVPLLDLLPPSPPLCSMMVAEPSSPQLDQLLHPHPAVHNWMQRVRQAVGPAVYDDAHSKLRAAVQRLAGAGQDRAASKL